MALPVTFAGLTAATGSQLDQNFAALGALTPVPCTVAGTNALVLTPNANTPSVAAYANYMQFSGVVATTNSGATTARVGALAILNVYKDSASGPIALAGGELIGGNAFTLIYDSTLNAGSGGFHLVSSTAGVGVYLPTTGGTVTGALVGSSLGSLMFPLASITAASIATLTAPLILSGSAGSASLSSATIANLLSANASLTSLRIGASAATIARILSAQATVTFTVVPANTNQLQTIAVPGALVNDVVQVGPPASVVAGTSFMGHVLASGTVGITAINSTTASLTPTGGLYRVAVTGFG